MTTLLGGAYGNAVYRRHVIKKIRKARMLDLADQERAEVLRLRGGVSFAMPAIAAAALAATAAGIAAMTLAP